MASRSTNRPTPQIIGFGLLVLASFAFWFFAPSREWVELLSDWIKDRGALGILIFGVVYVVAVVLLVPSWPFTIAAGLIFGFWGIPLIIVFATLGATAAFFVARYALRKRVAAYVRQRPKLHAVDRAIKQQGAKIVLLLRLSPAVPFNLQNYFFGVTDVRAISYVAATFVGIIPGTALYVYLGTLGKLAATGGALDGPQIALLAVGLVATIAAIAIITHKARQALNKAGR